MDLFLVWLIVAGLIAILGIGRELRKRQIEERREQWLARLHERQQMRTRYGLGRERRW